MRTRALLPFVAGVVVGALLMTLVWIASAPEPTPRESDSIPAPTDAPPDEVTSSGRPRLRIERTAEPRDPGPSESRPEENVADETGSVELEFPPGLRLSKGSWTGGFEVFGRAPNWWEGGDDFLTPVASRALAQAEQAAASHVSTNPEPDAATVRALLASPRPTDWEAGIVLASRLDPPLVDELVAVVHDPSFGAMRLAAALLLSRVDPVPSELGPALVELSRSDDAWQALGAVQLFPTGGDAVVERAVELLRSGRTIPALWAPLQVLASRSEAAHARYRDLLLSTPDVEVGLLVALPVVEADPGDPEVLSAVARLLREAGDGHPLLDHLVARVPLDPALAADRRIPWRTRLAILGGGERDMPTNERSDRGRALLDAVSRCIADAAEPETFLLELLSELTVQDASHPGVSASLWSVQASHPSPFVREEARTVLRRAGEGAVASWSSSPRATASATTGPT